MQLSDNNPLKEQTPKNPFYRTQTRWNSLVNDVKHLREGLKDCSARTKVTALTAIKKAPNDAINIILSILSRFASLEIRPFPFPSFSPYWLYSLRAPVSVLVDVSVSGTAKQQQTKIRLPWTAR